MGSPITEGRRYRLKIDADWHDARGVRLVEGAEKAFSGGPSDRTLPDPKLWQLSAPRMGTREPLTIRFPKPMDYALLQRMIQVEGCEGAVAIGKNETEWIFTPDRPWAAGRHEVIAESTLEDIAGNHLNRAFDVDLKDGGAHEPDKPVRLTFEVR
jgi:hypothetical protein